MKIILVACAICLSVASFSQVTMKLGSIENAEPGTFVNIPLIVSGLSQPGHTFIAVEIYFYFQDNIISYDSLANGNPETPVNEWFAGSTTGKVSANWLEPALDTINVPDNSVLVEFVFFYSGGQTDLTLDEATSGIFDFNGNAIPIAQFINGTITQAQGSESSVWNGTGPWATPANWTQGIPGDITNAIINSGTVELTSGAVCNNLSINVGSKILIQPGNSLTVSGDFTNSGEILIYSDSLIQGSLIVLGSITQTGSSEMEMKIYNGLSYLFTSPSQEVTASEFTGSGPVSGFLENSNTWSTVSGTEILNPFTGYKIDASGNSTMLFDGLFNSSDESVNLQFTSQGNAANEGWNLVGNSYSSSFDADNYLSTVNADRAIYIWDENNYRVWNGTAGSIPGGIIPPMTAFFVKANASNAQVTFNADGRIHDFTHYNGSYTTPSNVLPVYFKNFSDDPFRDVAYVQVENGSTVNFDGDFDAFKLSPPANKPEIYLHSADNRKLAISAIPVATELLAGVKVPSDGTYEISAQTTFFLPERPSVYLIDTELEVTKDLRIENYVFQTTAGDHPERFKIVFTGLGTEDQAQESNLLVYGSNDKIIINSLVQLGNSIISVYDLSGRQHSQSREMLGQGSVAYVHAISGINIITIETDSKVFHFKVIATK